MSNPGKTVNVRLPSELHAKFEELTTAIPGLTKGNIMKLLLAHTLNQPIDDQIKIVMSELLGPEKTKANELMPCTRKSRTL